MLSCKTNKTFRNSSKDPTICFGYATALEILRASVDPSTLPTARGPKFQIPHEPPGKQIVLDAIEQIEKIYPAFNVRRPAHVLVRQTNQVRKSSVCVSHLCKTSLPNGSLKQVGSLLVSSPALAFTQMAAQLKSPLAVIQLGFELCGTYQTRKTAAEHAYQVPPLTSARILRDFATHNFSLSGVKKARRALRYIADGSASPRETKLALLLGLPLMYGGYGFGMPRMNYEVTANISAKDVSGRSSLRCDLCWPEAKLDVEYQSREMHTGEVSRIRDSRRTNALESMGWTIVNITNDELDSFYTMNAIAATIRKYLGKKQRGDIEDHQRKNLKLRKQLGLSTHYL